MEVKVLKPEKLRRVSVDISSPQLKELSGVKLLCGASQLELAHKGRSLAAFPDEVLTVRNVCSSQFISALGDESAEPIAEVFNTAPAALLELVDEHNRRVAPKNPLMVDFSSAVRDSLLGGREDKTADYSGFLNAAVLISFLYFAPSMISELRRDLSLAPALLVSLATALLRFDALLFIALIFAYFAGAHIIQIFAFTNETAEHRITIKAFALSVVYVVFGFALTLRLELPALLAGGANTLIVFGLLKVVSYAHVLAAVRWSLAELRNCANERARRRFLDENLNAINAQILLENEHCFSRFLSLRAFVYYLFAPTFCYQLAYPRTPSIRKLWLIQQTFGAVALAATASFIAAHRVYPILREAPELLRRPTLSAVAEYLLRLAIPYTLFWITAFFAVFHFSFNALSELLRFGDRVFYRDWWNCRSLAEYWRNWNLPVHHFMLRHVNRPLQNIGLPPVAVGFAVFFASASAHEYVASLAAGKARVWFLASFTLQYGLILLELAVQNAIGMADSRLGNFCFWLSLCVVGQPALLTLYYLAGTALA